MAAAKDPVRRQRQNRSDIAHRAGGHDVPKVRLLRARRRAFEPPAPRKEWLAATKAEWGAAWTADVSEAWVPSDVPALLRLFDLKDERERAQRGVRTRRMVKGSMGQPVLNPYYALIKQCDGEIRQLEDRFGGTLTARLKAFTQAGQAAQSLEELNRAGEHDAEQDQDDPVAALLVAGSDGRRSAPAESRPEDQPLD